MRCFHSYFPALLLAAFLFNSPFCEETLPEEEALSIESEEEKAPEDWRAGILANILFTSHYVSPGENLGFPAIADNGTDDMRDGFILFQKGEFEASAKSFECAHKKTALLANYALFYKMMSCLKSGRTAEALQTYQAIVSAKSEPDMSVRAGVELIRSGVACASPFCLDMIEGMLEKKRDPDMLFLAARQYHLAGEAAKSIHCCVEIIKKYALSPYADSAYGLFLSGPKMTELDADKTYFLCRYLFLRRDYRGSLELASTVRGARGGLKEKYAILRGRAAYSLNQFANSLRIFQQLERETGPSPSTVLYIARNFKKLKEASLSRAKYLEYLALYPGSESCENILWEMGRNYEENKEYDNAISFYQRIYRQYRDGNMANRAYFKEGYCLYKKGLLDSATAVFCRHGLFFSDNDEISASFYWAGRLYEKSGLMEYALKWYAKSVENNPLCYYASRARQRLITLKAGWMASRSFVPAASAKSYFVSIKGYQREFPAKIKEPVRDAFFRSSVLRDCGLYEHALREARPIERFLKNDFLFQYYLIKTYETHGFFREAHRLSRNLMTKISSGEYGRMPPDVVRTFYPRYFGEVVDAECVRYGLDPLFVHALIRQESVYNPAIVSFAGAIGLMQLMPATAGEEAGRMKIEFARDSLFNPVYNIRIGVHHVDDLFGRLEQKNEWVLCAYNAGLSATRTWIRKNRKLEYDDFVEEIAYTETRGYVKKCMQNYWLYQQYWQ